MRDRLSRIFILLMAISLVACNDASSGTDATPTPIPTSIVPTTPTYEVQVGDIVKQVEFFGRIAPVTETELFFRTSGFVKNVYVANGDTVTTGQVVAELENVAELGRQNESNQLQVRLAELDLADAELALAAFDATLPDPDILIADATQAVIESELAVIELQTAVDMARATVNRATSNQSVTVQMTNQLTLELAESQLVEAQIILSNAQSEKVRLGVSPVPLGWEEERQAMRNSVERAQLFLDQVNFADADLASAIADARIVAPFDGTILSFGLVEGRAVEAFNRIVVIGDTTELEIRADLSGNELVGLTEDMTVLLSLFNSAGEPVEGHISQLPSFSDAAEGSGDEANRFTRISLAAPPADSGFELNDRVRVTAIIESREDVLWLPPQAIRTFDGRNFVVIQEENGQRRIDVKSGLRTGDRVEILPIEGVENIVEGQQVIAP